MRGTMDKQKKQTPFVRGLKDFYQGNISDPYAPNTQDSRDWQFGFNKSYFANLERLNAKTQKTSARG